MKTRKSHTLAKSTPTLTQSGLLAVLLQRQHYKVIQLARRRAQRKHARAVLWSNLTWLLARRSQRHRSSTIAPTVWREPSRAPHLNLSAKPIAMSPQIHTYTELRQQIHDDLRIQHPEWVKSNGECPTCDSYESRLTEMLGITYFKC